MSDALNGWIEEHREEFVEAFSRLIQIPTVSGVEDEEGRAEFQRHVRDGYRLLTAEAEKWGLRTRNYRDWALVIEGGDGDEVIGFPLHIDVVPPGEGWRHGNPFSGIVDDGQIWGRGTQDNKGSLMAALHALAAIVSLGEPMRRRVRLIIGQGEEVGDWDDVIFVRDQEGAPLYSIVADSSFPVVTGEKGWVNARLTVEWDEASQAAATVLIDSLVSGDRPNIVPDLARASLSLKAGAPTRAEIEHLLRDYLAANERARIEISWPNETHCEVTAHGKRAHGSRPDKGHSALLDLTGFLSGTLGERLGPAPFECMRELHTRCSDFSGGGWGIAMHDEFLGPTSVSLGTMRLEGRRFVAVLNIRPTLGLPAAETLERVRAALEEWRVPPGVEAHVQPQDLSFDAFREDPADLPELIGALEGAWRDVTGAEPKHLVMSGTTYAKVFPNALGFGPCWDEQEPGLFHQIDERIPVESHLRNVRLFAEAIRRLAV